MKERVLFFALAVLHLVPFWVVTYVPTVDGPSHVYNAWVQAHLGDTEHYPALREYFEIDHRPLPNWTAQVSLRALLLVLPPAAAEKTFVSGYVLLFLLAARYFAGAVDPTRRWLAFLAFPFALNATLHNGFYSFAISVALYLFALGFWWRGWKNPGWRFALVLNGLLLGCYFSHLVSLFVALGSLGVLWLATLPAAIRADAFRRHLLHLPILLPQIVLPLWFLAGQPHRLIHPKAFATWSNLFLDPAVYAFGVWPQRLILLLAFFLLILLTLWKPLRRQWSWREEDGWLLLALSLVVVFLLAPDRLAGGSLIKLRLALYPWLALLPWLAPPPAPNLRRALVVSLALLGVWDVATVASAYRARDRTVTAFLAAADGIPANTRVVALVFGAGGTYPGPPELYHVFDRAAVAQGAVDRDDYEAWAGHFPVSFHPGVADVPTDEIATDPKRIDPRSLGGEIDYFYCWNLQPDSETARWLDRRYRLIRQEGLAALFERRDRVRRARQESGAPDSGL